MLAWAAAEHRVTGKTSTLVPAPASLEGLLVWRDALYVAARQGGLLRAQLDGGKLTALPLPPAAREPWDVAALDDKTLLIAAGRAGLLVLDFGADPDQPRLIATLPLPGLSVAVSVSGRTAYVAALSGGGHAVDLTDPQRPTRTGSITNGSLIYDLRAAGSLVVASSGYHHVVARWIDGKLQVVGVRRSTSWALATTDGEGGLLYSAEFGIAGRYRLDESRGPGPYLRLPAGANAPARGTLSLSLPVQNLGDAPLVVDRVHLDSESSLAERASAPGFIVPPGGTRFVDLSLDAEDYSLVVEAPGNLGSQSRYDIRRTRGLQPGDMLPAPLAYHDLARHRHDVLGGIKGKVGFVMIGASSCPVAFYALHASRFDLAALVTAGAVAAYSIDPWDDTDHGDMLGLDDTFPHLLSPLTTADNHDHSEVLDKLGQNGFTGPPMPIVYVVGRDGIIRFAQWGYEPVAVKRALAAALAEP